MKPQFQAIFRPEPDIQTGRPAENIAQNNNLEQEKSSKQQNRS